MSSLDLSDALVNSMRTLFNILDPKQNGFILFEDIEKHWSKNNNREFIENLRKICPKNHVTFEKFCIALKMNKIQNRVSANPPPKPPRSLPPADQFSRVEIMNNLQKWQKSVISSKLETNFRDLGDGQNADQNAIYAQPQRHQKSRRKDRRHTLQNSIDFKQLKQIELEKEILLQGFAQIEKARNWYLKQLSLIDDKINAVASGNHRFEYGSHTDTQQERWELQKLRINDANRSLGVLMDNWDRRGGFPMHINLEIRSKNYPGLKN